jgi:hypothetical protein
VSVSMTWTGPGSPSDPDYNPDVAGAPIITKPTVVIQKTSVVVIDTHQPPVVVPKRIAP